MRNKRFGNVTVVLFFLVQVGDGTLTYLGVSVEGYPEANPFLVWVMMSFGDGLGIVMAKTAAASLGVFLHLAEVHMAVFSLVVLYVCTTIIPWSFVLFW